MRGFLAVARREIAERRFVFAAAAAASLIPFAVPLVRGLDGQAAAEVRDWLALILAATFAAGLAAGLGATVLASDLASRRLGFHFSRPVSGLAIWAGKLGASSAIALAAGALIWLPAFLADRGRFVLAGLPRRAPGTLAGGVVLLVFLSHAASVAIRARSPLLAADLAALILLALVSLSVIHGLTTAFASEALVHATTSLVVIAAAGIVAAGIVAVTHGRTDGHAAHRALSATLWGILGVGVFSLAGYAHWVLSAGPRDLKEVDLALPASSGSWVIVEGPARGGLPAFLLDTATGRYERAGADWRWPVLSPDGTRAAWFDPSGPGGTFEVVTWELDERGSKPVRTNLTLPGTPAAFLSEHGERLATIAGGLLSIYDLATGASLGSAHVADERTYVRGFFLDRNRFRIFRPIESSQSVPGVTRLQILEFDAATRALSATGTLEDVNAMAYAASPSGDRLLVREKDRITLRDGRSGTLLASLLERAPAMTGPGRFLADGRIAVALATGSDVRLEVFAPDGSHERTLPIPAHDRIALGGEAAPGKLVVAAGGDPGERASRTIFLADLSSGEVRQVADRLFPAAYLAGWLSGRPNYLPEPGGEATKLFFGPGRCLVRLDPSTGERRVILPGSSR
ncbi:MAG: hypothetical protein ACRD1B_05815 [Thermoanaerobaculia bacterium]